MSSTRRRYPNLQMLVYVDFALRPPMRKEFSSWIENFGRNERRFIFLTGDLGLGALENVQVGLQERFVNMGVCDQNMISVGAELAQLGLMPLCYSSVHVAVFMDH